MWATILQAILAFLQAIPIVAKYLPKPKTPEEIEQEVVARVEADLKASEKSGRGGSV